MQSLSAWLDHLERLHPKTIDLGLDRILEVSKRLGLSRPSCPVITVAGTNGKGSTVRLLETIYREAGYRVACYTSPHLCVYNERIRLNGGMASDEFLIEGLSHVEAVRGDITLSYFEFGTLAALYGMFALPWDLIILEVGLGGRLDAVNIIDPDLSFISSIGLDHTEYLGNTREAIAREKAGIFRASVPAIVNDPNPPDYLIDLAATRSAPTYFLGPSYQSRVETTHWHWSSSEVELPFLPRAPLGEDNAAGVLMALQCLHDRLPISRAALDVGLQSATLPGRMQQIPEKIPVILDGAHNPAAAKRVFARLKTSPCQGKTLVVMGMLADKDISGTMKVFSEIADEIFLGGLAHRPRGATVELLQEAWASVSSLPAITQPSLLEAYRFALASAGKDDRILLTGSFSSVAEILMVYNSPPIDLMESCYA